MRGIKDRERERERDKPARFNTMGENCTRKLVATIEENSSGKVGRSGEKCASVYFRHYS